MANELRITARVLADKGDFTYRFQPPTLLVDLTNAGRVGGVQQVGTSWEALVVGTDVTSPGYAVFQNINTGSQYVDVAVGSTSSPNVFTRLQPGQFALLPLQGVTLAARAATDAATTAVVPLNYDILAS